MPGIQTAVKDPSKPFDGPSMRNCVRTDFTLAPGVAQNFGWRDWSLANFSYYPTGVYIDNSAGTAECTITVNPPGFVMKVAAGTSQFRHFPASIKDQSFTISGNGNVALFWVDYAAGWQTDSLGSSGGTVSLAASEAHVGQVGGTTVNPSSQFNRPADTTAYASGDLVANSTVAGNVIPLSWATAARIAGGSFIVRRCRLAKSTAVIANAAFRLHLYSTSPVVTNGDNGAWLSTQAATYLGSLEVSYMLAFSDGATGIGSPLVGMDISIDLAAGQTIYGLLEARGAYAPGNAETFTAVLELYQD